MVVVVGGVGKLVGSIGSIGDRHGKLLIGSGTLALLLAPVKPLADLFFATTSMARVLVFAIIAFCGTPWGFRKRTHGRCWMKVEALEFREPTAAIAADRSCSCCGNRTPPYLR